MNGYSLVVSNQRESNFRCSPVTGLLSSSVLLHCLRISSNIRFDICPEFDEGGKKHSLRNYAKEAVYLTMNITILKRPDTRR